MSSQKRLPVSVLQAIEEILPEVYTHDGLNALFQEVGAPGEVPVANKLDKCRTWLRRINAQVEDPASMVGRIIEDIMERDVEELWYLGESSKASSAEDYQERISKALKKQKLKYERGGAIVSRSGSPEESADATFSATPTATLHALLRSRDLAAVNMEFQRASEQTVTDPPAALTAACAIIEATCKVYIEDEKLVYPSSPTIKPLWAVVQKNLGLDPARLEDDDLKKVLSGLTSIVDGIGSVRTHASSAHGRGRTTYRVQERHARLVVNAAHTLVSFVLETWDTRKDGATGGTP